MRAIYTIKAVAVTSILVMVWILQVLVFPDIAANRISLSIMVALLPTVAVAGWRGEVPSWLLAISFTADIIAVTSGTYAGGGIDNVSGPLLYALVIALGGVILHEWVALFAAGGSAVAYGVMVWAERQQLAAHHLVSAKSPEDAMATVIRVGLYLFLIAWVVSYAVRQIRVIYQRVEELRGEVLHVLSHDIGDPLGIIDGNAQLVEDSSPEERRPLVHAIRRSARQALDLVRNVIDAAAIEVQPFAPQRQPLQVNALVEQVINLYRFDAEWRGVRLVAGLAADLPPIKADAQLLSRAVGNLLSNAIKYTDRDGAVDVATGRDGEGVHIIVRDSGRGVRAVEQTGLYVEHQQPRSKSEAAGTGLGLYIARCIVEAHGGTLGVNSESDKGSVFTIALPL